MNMSEKNTDDLRRELINSQNLNRFLEENRDSFQHEQLPETLNRLFYSRTLTKTALAKRSEMSEVYLHQVFAGRRKPSRNRLLCLCIGLEASLEEARDLLLRGGHAPLYPGLRRDAIILYGLSHKEDIHTVNEKLFQAAEAPLC